MVIFDTHFSILQIIKILFIILMLFVNLYMFYILKKSSKKELNYSQNLNSGIGALNFKFIKKVGAFILATFGAYSSMITIEDRYNNNNKKIGVNTRENLDNAISEIKEKDKEIVKMINLNNQFKSYYEKVSHNMSELLTEALIYIQNLNLFKSIDKIFKDNISKTEDPLIKIKSESVLKEEFNNLVCQNKVLVLNKSLKKADEYKDLVDIDKIQKAAFLDFEVIWTFINSLDIFHRIAFSLLIFNTIIISSNISIVFIFYGDYLLKKYNIEERYPKLAKIIQLRRKLQRYYLLAAISWIFLVSITEILFSIAILAS